MNPFTFIRDQQAFLSGRGFSVGSSDLPTILGVNRFQTARELWERKLSGEASSAGDSARWGHWLEPLTLREFIRRRCGDHMARVFYADAVAHEEYRPENYSPPTPFLGFTECRMPDIPWAMAHADLLWLPEDGEPEIIEAKSGKWFSRIGNADREGFDLDDFTEAGIPLDVRLQVEWQKMCYDIGKATTALLIDDNEYHEWPSLARRELWPKMIEAASKFMWCLKTGKSPPPMTKADVFKIFPEAQEQTAFVVGEQASLAEAMANERKEIKRKIKRLEGVQEDLENALMLLHGDNRYLYNGDTAKVISKQVYSPGQFSALHPSTIKNGAPEAYEILEKAGMIKTHDRRYLS